MKKLLFSLTAIVLLFLYIIYPGSGTEAQVSNSSQAVKEIPDEAIRLRILANSNTDADQQLKRLIRDEVNAQINSWVKDMTDIEEARDLIEEQLPEIKKTVARVLNEQGKSQGFNVEYSDEISFPAKLYGSYLYPAGQYEAVLITLGEGEGENWWCVLFPPLCFLDFSSGTSVAEAEVNADAEPVDVAVEAPLEEEKPKVKFFLLEWFS
ncbi:stage II sporulation protein R [Terribacillus saccharophilus]|uniref:Stage II sporulation protein R n=1 Tax=Terribacillus saccharophilus TaxID=361277 RepID=A0A268HI16_9BACI|nr:stage II sporulation protein R [Terribacillus saccharophilus]PAE09490.1 stage II sporulation protein R [Terribacillus saccharophilus]